MVLIVKVINYKPKAPPPGSFFYINSCKKCTIFLNFAVL